MLQKMAIALCATAALVLAVGLLLPRSWSVERSVVIERLPEEIHPFIAAPQRWHEWAVWTRGRDARARYSYAGPIEGQDSERSWIGPAAGQGRIRVVEADPSVGVLLAASLEASVPNAQVLIGYQAVDPGGQSRSPATRVSWRDEGRLPLPLGGYFRGELERTLGGAIDESLGRLKALVEQQPPRRPGTGARPGASSLN